MQYDKINTQKNKHKRLYWYGISQRRPGGMVLSRPRTCRYGILLHNEPLLARLRPIWDASPLLSLHSSSSCRIHPQMLNNSSLWKYVQWRTNPSRRICTAWWKWLHGRFVANRANGVWPWIIRRGWRRRLNASTLNMSFHWKTISLDKTRHSSLKSTTVPYSMLTYRTAPNNYRILN